MSLYPARRQHVQGYRYPEGIRCRASSKVCHARFYDAMRHIKRLVQIGEELALLHCYRCPECGYYHVGHKNPNFQS